MRTHCDDCGTRLERGSTCPNCMEALFIYETQNEYLPDQLSQEFVDQVNHQHERREAQRRENG